MGTGLLALGSVELEVPLNGFPNDLVTPTDMIRSYIEYIGYSNFWGSISYDVSSFMTRCERVDPLSSLILRGAVAIFK